MKTFFYDLTYDDIARWVEKQKLPKFRAEQIYRWQKEAVQSPDEMTNLSKELRRQVGEAFSFDVPELVDCMVSNEDGTHKYLFKLADGPMIEAVLMRYKYGLSLCLSTQAGCRMGCAFCASTRAGLQRNLTAGEMVYQVAVIERWAKEEIKRIVLMGIGEPLENLDHVLNFMARVHDPRLFDISYRRLTLSTCGIVPQIYELAKADLPINLAISLHSAMQDKRASIMPIAKRYGLQELLRAADDYQATTGRRVSFEYTMFRDVNDSEADLAALIHLLKDRGSHVNLIPANHFPGSDFDTPDRERVEAFAAGLNDAGITTTVRRSLGQDIDAACGQLRLRHLAKTDG